MLDEHGGSPLFPAAMVPVLTVPAASGLPDDIRSSIQTHHLYRYLNFTVLLESLVVNKTLLEIYLNKIGFTAGPALRLDALRMYTDEAYHTLAAADLAQQVERLTRIPNHSAGDLDAVFLRRLGAIKERASTPSVGALLELVFVIISETLISGNLSDVSDDASINDGVRSVIEDHARDEGRHHAFFHAYLESLWGVMTPAERVEVGRAVPPLIHAFFAPERESVEAELDSYALAPAQARELVETAYARDRVESTVRASSADTVRYFEELGALEVPQIADSFAELGLLPGRV